MLAGIAGPQAHPYRCPQVKSPKSSAFLGRWWFCAETAKAPAARRRAPGLDHHGPGVIQPADRPSVYLSRTPAPTTAGQAPSSGWPLFGGLHLYSPPSSGRRAFTVDNHSSSRSHEAHPLQDGSSISPLICALSTPSSSTQQQLFSYLLLHPNVETRKQSKRKYKTRRETGKDNQRRKRKKESSTK